MQDDTYQVTELFQKQCPDNIIATALKLKLSSGGTTFEAMRFGSGEALNTSIDAVFRPSINEFRGAKTLQLTINHTA